MNLFKKAIFKKITKIIVNTPTFLISVLNLIYIKTLAMYKKINTDNIIIVSASDKYFYLSLVQLLENLKRLNLQNKVIIYDIGLEGWQVDNIAKYDILLKNFNFSEYPKFIATRDEKNKLGHYAWKPVIIYTTLLKYKTGVLWLDTGNTINKSLQNTLNTIVLNGFISPFSVGKIKEWTHPKTLKKFLHEDPQIGNKRNLTGGLVGFSWQNPEARNVAKEWFELSIKEEIIAPENSSRENHRQDQSILSIITNKSNLLRFNISYKFLLGIKVNQNPGVKIFNLDININDTLSSLRKKWESIDEQSITKTISRSDAVMLLSQEEIVYIPKKYLRKKKIFLLVNDPNITINKKYKKYIDALFTQNKKIKDLYSRDLKVFQEESLKDIFNSVKNLAQSY